MFKKGSELALEGVASKRAGGFYQSGPNRNYLAGDEELEFRQDVVAIPCLVVLHQPTRAGFSTASSFLEWPERFVASRSTLAKAAPALAKAAQ